MTVDYPDWTTSQDHAAKIYAQTVPLGRKPLSLGMANIVVPASGSSTLISGQATQQTGYQMVVFMQQGVGAPTTPFCRFRFTWTDSASGFSVQSDTFILPIGAAASTIFILTGPVRMDSLTIVADNLDPAVTVGLSFAFSNNSNIYTAARCVEVDSAAVAAFTRAGVNGQMGVVGVTSAGLAAGATADRLCAAWSGKAVLSVDNDTGTVDVVVRILDPGIIAGGTPLYGTAASGIIAAVRAPAGTTQVTQLALPGGPVVIREINLSGTTGVTPTTCIIAEDH